MQQSFQLAFEKHPTPRLWISGQVDAAQLAQLKAAGVAHIINLRPASEDPSFDEAQAANSLGLSYHELPISGAGDLNLANAQALDQLLQTAGDAPTLIHCASGNRVGALFALRAAWIQNQPAETALAIGRDHGLTKMEPIVAGLLGAA